MNRKLCILFAVLLVVLPFATPTGATGQSLQQPCGDLSHAQERLELYFPYFTEDRYAVLRDTALQQLSPDATHHVVTDPRVCHTVMQAVRKEVRGASNWKEIEKEFTKEIRVGRFLIFRYGPYYAVLLKHTALPPGIRSTAHAPLEIYRADDLTCLTAILV